MKSQIKSGIFTSFRPQPHILDPRSVATLRILLSFYILYDIFISRLGWSISFLLKGSNIIEHTTSATRFWLAWYTSIPSSSSILLPDDTPHKAPIHQYWFYRGTIYFQLFGFIMTILLAILFGIGYKCKPNPPIQPVAIIPFLLWLNIVALQARSQGLCDGSDTYLRSFLFWCMMMDTSKIWSVDCYLTHRSNEQTEFIQESDVNKKNQNRINNILGISNQKTDSMQTLLRKRSNTIGQHPATLLGKENASNMDVCQSKDVNGKAIKLQNSEQTNIKQDKYRELTYTNKSKRTIETSTHCDSATLGLTLQVVFMYLGTVSSRLKGHMWLYPEFTAVYYALSHTFSTKQFSAHLLQLYPFMSKYMTFHAMLTETFAPILCFLSPYQKFRHYPSFLIATLHFGLLIMMRLPNWQLLAIISCIIWIPSDIWDHLQINHWGLHPMSNTSTTIHWYLWWLLPTPIKLKDPTIKKNEISNIKKNKRRQTIFIALKKHWFSSFFLFYMIYNWMGERNWISKLDNGNIGEAIRFSQHWVMFSPDVGTDCFTTVYTGFIPTKSHIISQTDNNVNENETKMDLLCAMKFNEWGDESTIYQKSCIVSNETYLNSLTTNIENMSSQYPSMRFERILTNWVKDAGNFNISRKSIQMKNFRERVNQLGRVVCMMGNRKRKSLGLAPIEKIEMAFRGMKTLPPNKVGRFIHESNRDMRVELKC